MLHMPLKLAIFDLDGTLLVQALDFEAIRREVGLPPVVPLLETMLALDEAARVRAFAILDRHEADAATRSDLMPGAREILDWLRGGGVRTGVLTRNSRVSIDAARRRHGLAFDAVITREDHKPKPCPDGVHHLMALFGAGPGETVAVGDYRFDIEAGRSAGVRTIALISEPKPWAAAATWTASTLADVQTILGHVAAEP
jgi:HAD superfamily hydrolase (TIGR01509 family)